MEFVLDTAFVISTVAFFKEQLGLSGKASLGAAFAVALVLSLAPVLAALFPAVGVWVEGLVRTIILFLSAAGGVDAVKQFARTGKKAEKK